MLTHLVPQTSFMSQILIHHRPVNRLANLPVIPLVGLRVNLPVILRADLLVNLADCLHDNQVVNRLVSQAINLVDSQVGNLADSQVDSPSECQLLSRVGCLPFSHPLNPSVLLRHNRLVSPLDSQADNPQGFQRDSHHFSQLCSL
jgi:hypothetical protein